MFQTYFSLLKDRRFTPFFLVQFLGAFNDNFFKQAMVLMILFQIDLPEGLSSSLLVMIASVVFIIPFCVFSASAGLYVDQTEKSYAVRWTKMMELFAMIIGAVGLVLGHVWILMGALFFMGLQSSLFGPLKYSYMPQVFKESQIQYITAMINASTFLAILIGLMLSGIIVALPGGPIYCAVAVIFFALLGLLAAYKVNSVPILKEKEPFHWRCTLKYMFLQYRLFFQDKNILYLILWITWFWCLGVVYLTQFPIYGREVLNVDEGIVTLLIVGFTLGIGLGSFMASYSMKSYEDISISPYLLIFVFIFSIDLWFISYYGNVNHLPTGVFNFLSNITGIHIFLDCVGLAICAGGFTLPFYSTLQIKSEPHERARNFAFVNVVNSLSMLLISGLCILLVIVGFDIQDLFLMVGILSLVVAASIYFSKTYQEIK